MSRLTYAMTDSATMLRRQLRHMVRYPIALMLIGLPVIILLLFVYVFGGTLGAGLGGTGVASGRVAAASTSTTSPPASCSSAWRASRRGRRSRWPWT
jgi:hypothetical protein